MVLFKKVCWRGKTWRTTQTVWSVHTIWCWHIEKFSNLLLKSVSVIYIHTIQMHK
jgi:hypothetical protein